jgi:hypothetical protein
MYTFREVSVSHNCLMRGKVLKTGAHERISTD